MIHVESGRSASLEGDGQFQMMSVFTLPIALAVLHEVDRGAESAIAEATRAAHDWSVNASGAP